MKLVKLKGKRHRLPARQKQIIREKLQRLEDGAIYYNDDYKNSDEEEEDATPKVTRKRKGNFNLIKLNTWDILYFVETILISRRTKPSV